MSLNEVELFIPILEGRLLCPDCAKRAKQGAEVAECRLFGDGCYIWLRTSND